MLPRRHMVHLSRNKHPNGQPERRCRPARCSIPISQSNHFSSLASSEFSRIASRSESNSGWDTKIASTLGCSMISLPPARHHAYHCNWSSTMTQPNMAFHVTAPTTPSTNKLRCFCHARTRLSVAAPKSPSGVAPTTACTSFTASPCDPSRNGRPG